MDGADLVAAVRSLRSYGPPEQPSRHQAVLLLWALGRARHGLPRLTRWSTVRQELTLLLAAHGLANSAATPEYPFVALHRTPLWEVNRPDVPAAHGSGVLPWLNSTDPKGGLSPSVYDLLTSDDVARGEVVGALLNRYFAGEPADDLLRDVGLYSGAPGLATAWDLRAGDIARRQVVHKRFGGQEQGGISTPLNGKWTLLFADSTGSLYGYDYDGWKTDGSYHYTGQGRTGDQRFTATNRSVLDPGREIHVFEEAARTVIRYVGQFKPDNNEPFYRTDTPDTNSEIRSAIVFRLWPIDRTVQPSQPTQVADETMSFEVPVESHNINTFTANPASGPTEAERREAALVQRYRDWLNTQDIPTVRNKIQLAGQPRPLLTDLFNQHTQELVEAKSSATRDHVRLALGQILDYARYVPHRSLAVLLPVRPAEDLVDLLAAHNIACIYELTANTFDRADTPTSQRAPMGFNP